LSDNICPFKIVIPADPLVSFLPPPNKTANLKKIEFLIHNPVLLRLLACKEEKTTTNDCPYPIHKNPDAVNAACRTKDEIAHLYLRHEIIDNIARSCVVYFTDTTYLFTPDGLLELFKNTVKWLNIGHEKPYFYVILRYKEPKTAVNTEYNRKIVNRELRKIYKGYSLDEDICTVIPANKQADLLRIEHTNESKKFYIDPK